MEIAPASPSRLPSERRSFTLRVTRGSAWSPRAGSDGAGFRYGGPRSLPECIMEIALTRVTAGGDFEQVFLTDADLFAMSDVELDAVLFMLCDTFRGLQLISAATRPASVLARAPDVLRRLRDRRLGLLYFTPESGDPAVLERLGVDASLDDFAAAAVRAHQGGLLVGVVIVLGAAGPDPALAHARASAALLTRMNPRHVTLVAETDRGHLAPRAQLVEELAVLLVETRTDDTVVTTDLDVDGHPFEGRLPADRERLLARLQRALPALPR